MKTEKKIFFAFVLNLLFSVFEVVGGLFTGSVAILSDAIHDVGDATGIGISYLLEKKSKKQPDGTHTYGYARYSVLGGLLNTLILLIGSALVILNAAQRLIHPTPIDYNGMILFAVVGVIVNLAAALLTNRGDSLNQKAVNLHMLEDVLGWVVVLVGAVIMRFTDLPIIDPLMSIAVAIFILINALQTLQEILHILLENTPSSICLETIKEHLSQIDGVLDLHHIHIWSLDGQAHYATLHAVCKADPQRVKQELRAELKRQGIAHVTIETEAAGEVCSEPHCRSNGRRSHVGCHCHHGHHGHHHKHHGHNHGSLIRR